MKSGRRLAVALITAAYFIAVPGPLSAAGVPATRPAKLEIQKIEVDAAVESRGLTRRQIMRPPSSPWRAAWDSGGPVPGNPGEAVIYGHLTDNHFRPAVFYNLKKLVIGDKLSVTDTKGTVRTFKVIKKRTIRADRINYYDISRPSKYIHLNLYTCAGTWDSRLRRYTHFLVVYTTLVSVKPK